MRPPTRILLTRPIALRTAPHIRHRSSAAAGSATEPATASLSPRWLSDVKQRVGKCIMFGLQTSQQTAAAGDILKEVAQDWRELVAGSEGFLTGEGRRGLFRQEVVWGEMDSMLKERNGSSRQALKKYVLANNNLSGVSDATFTSQFNKALQKGSDAGVFDRPKGTSGPVKLAKGGETKKASSPAAAKKTETKAAPKAAPTVTKKAPAAKKAATKAAPKKTAAKKAAPKAAATKKAAAPAKTTKAKANSSKVRKSAAPAPAVEETKPVVLGKTKSGRVTKSTAPQAAAKKAAPKKKAPAKKAAATKKSPAKKAAA